MENTEIWNQDIYSLIYYWNGQIWGLKRLMPGEPPKPVEPIDEQPQEQLLLLPPMNPSGWMNSFRVWTMVDQETGYSLITSRRLRIWLFGDSARLEYGEDGSYVFAQGPEPELSDAIKKKFDYDPLKFPYHIHDLRERRPKLRWSDQEETALWISLIHFIPIEMLTHLFGRKFYALIGRATSYCLRYCYKGKLEMGNWACSHKILGIFRQKLMIRNNKILNILETPHYQWRREKKIQIIDRY